MTDKAPVIEIEIPATDSAPKRRGRPPGSKNSTSSTRTNSDVAKALATLDSAYDLISTGLFLANLPESAAAWASAATDLRSTNKAALESAPKLAKAIANVGGVGGAATFAITHVLAIGSLVRTLTNEIANRQEESESDKASSV